MRKNERYPDASASPVDDSVVRRDVVDGVPCAVYVDIDVDACVWLAEPPTPLNSANLSKTATWPSGALWTELLEKFSFDTWLGSVAGGAVRAEVAYAGNGRRICRIVARRNGDRRPAPSAI
ncbi:unnamed protein product, partial [Iphiclides podalirius]